jgi:hypothetical protein
VICAVRNQPAPWHRSDVAQQAPPHCRRLVDASARLLKGASPLSPDELAAAPPDCLRWLRHFLRLYPAHYTSARSASVESASIPLRVANPTDIGFDSIFEDMNPDLRALEIRSRIIPFGTGLRPAVIHPNETLSVAHGGTFPGVVTWVDNLWLARANLESHLWGWAQVKGSEGATESALWRESACQSARRRALPLLHPPLMPILITVRRPAAAVGTLGELVCWLGFASPRQPRGVRDPCMGPRQARGERV